MSLASVSPENVKQAVANDMGQGMPLFCQRRRLATEVYVPYTATQALTATTSETQKALHTFTAAAGGGV